VTGSAFTRADLHTHSTSSDGLDSPASLVRLASERGISVLALTDHDSVSGVAEAIAAAERYPIAVISGVEFSARARRGQTHILGYGIDIQNVRLSATLDELREGRERRGEQTIHRLGELGIELSPAFFEAAQTSGSPGRPHIARGLMRVGAATSIQDAFDRFLAVGRPAFVPRKTILAETAIDLIRAADGVAVLAHPLSVFQLDERLAELVAAGLGGLEVHYGAYSQDQRERLAQLATTYNLLTSGGSDYHGDADSNDRVLGSVHWPIDELNALLGRLK
jgi:predicted metal-dependent phosphoesterase TrpH